MPPPTSDTIVITKIIIAMIGGLVLSILNVNEDNKKPKNKQVPRNGFFYLMFALWPLLAGFLYWVISLDGSSIGYLATFVYGLTISTTVQNFASKGAAASAIKAADDPSVEEDKN